MNNNHSKKKIGLLVTSTDLPYSYYIVQGIEKVLHNSNTILICYIFGNNTDNKIYLYDILDLINSKNLHGLIISGSLSHEVSDKEFKKFYRKENDIPIATLSFKTPGIKACISDNSIGMRQLMIHLLDDHKYSKLAYIGGKTGQQESEIRKNIFISEMVKRKLSINEDWIIDGDFQLQSGIIAMEKLLSYGEPEFEGIVVANDEMALAAMKVSEAHGYIIPKDFFITGFDDFYSRKLTTVDQSIKIQAEEATNYILDKINNVKNKYLTNIPSTLIIRSSCGCSPSERMNYNSKQLLSKYKLAECENLFKDAFIQSVKKNDEMIFLNLLQTILSENHEINSGILWQTILSNLRKKVFPICKKLNLIKEASQLFDYGSLIIIDYPFSSELNTAFEAKSKSTQLQIFNEAISNTIEMDVLFDIFYRDLPIMGFKCCFLSLFENSIGPKDNAILKFAYNSEGPIKLPKDGIKFKANNLFPKEVCKISNDDTLLILEILICKREILGFVVFSADMDSCRNTNAVSLELSNAIKGVKLWQERKKNEEIIIHTEKMASLGSLVAGVAHEINSPIGIGITASSDLEESVLNIKKLYNNSKLTKSQFNIFMDKLKDESYLIERNLIRAGELIRSFKKIAVDQSHDTSRSFILKDYLKDIISSLNPLLRTNKHKCTIKCPNDIELYGPPGSIAQIFNNLINNSILHGFEKKSEGEIDIECELIENKLSIVYKDNGIGIESENINRIFEPFFSTKYDKGGSGLGLSIVNNLIIQIWKGKIKCTSENGIGTKFLIEIPISDFDSFQ